jgi:hypothetical protein
MPAATRGVLPSLKYEDACRIADIIDVMSQNYITTSLQIKAIDHCLQDKLINASILGHKHFPRKKVQ